jgi:ribonuclease P protein component
MFAVSKRNMKSAVKRNRIKRQFREAYRLQKPEFLDELERTMLNRFPLRLVFMYQHSNGELSFNEAKSSVRNALMKLIRKNECKTPNDEQAQ